ncbi:MAG: SUMF1/EgtB/PvdO family nonheme iron enzyme [Deltaproteobacteria bacterium]|nr:SUMF1/EgtB/PvdO family nonheme iron enzyme [Deltaproteobacteria bacterium]
MSKRKKYISAALLAAVWFAAFVFLYLAFFKKTTEQKEIASIKKALKQAPEDTELRHRLGLLYMYAGEFKKAGDEFIAILNVDPYNTRALNSLGMAYYRSNEPHKALTYWRTLLEIDPGNSFVWDLVNSISDPGGSGGHPHTGKGAPAPEWDKHYQAGQKSYQSRDYPKAIERFKMALKLNPKDFRSHFNLGSSYYEMGELKKAKESWQEGLKYKRDDLMTMRLITLADDGIERLNAIEGMKEGVRKEPSNWELYLKLGDAFLKDKRTVKDARRAYAKAMRLNPQRTDTYYKLMDLSARIDDYAGAARYARLLLEKSPDDTEAKERLKSYLAYDALLAKGRERWKKTGAAPYEETAPVEENGRTSFYIDRYEVTNAQYKAFLDSTGRLPPLRWGDISGTENLPVAYVSWYDALVYCRWAGKRLPTEEEWVKAGWRGSSSVYPWGSAIDSGKANTVLSGFGKNAPVGSYEAYNGVYDMIGNVMEWTASGQELKVRRGGSFETDPKHIQRASRWLKAPEEADEFTGFRCLKAAN